MEKSYIEKDKPPIDLYLIFEKIKFEKSIWTNLNFSLFQTWILQAKQAVKIKFKTDKKSSSSNLIFQSRIFKNQVHINMGKV